MSTYDFYNRVTNGHYSVQMWRRKHFFPVQDGRSGDVQKALDLQFDEDLLAHHGEYTRKIHVCEPEVPALERLVPRRKKAPVAATEPAAPALDNGYAPWAREMLAQSHQEVAARGQCQDPPRYQTNVMYAFQRLLAQHVQRERLKCLPPNASIEEKIDAGDYDAPSRSEEFRLDLFKCFGVTHHPKAKKVYEMALDRANGEGFTRIASEFGELAALLA